MYIHAQVIYISIKRISDFYVFDGEDGMSYTHIYILPNEVLPVLEINVFLFLLWLYILSSRKYVNCKRDTASHYTYILKLKY